MAENYGDVAGATGGGLPIPPRSSGLPLGQNDPIAAMLENAARQYSQASQTTGLERMFSGRAKARQAQETLTTLLPLQKELRAQDTATLQAEGEARKQHAAQITAFKGMAELIEGAATKHFAMSPAEQKQFQPVLEWIFTQGDKMAGTGIGDKNIQRAFRIKDYAAITNRLMTKEPLMEDDDRAELSLRVDNAKTDEEALKAATDKRAEMQERAASFVRMELPKIAMKIGAAPGTGKDKPFTEATAAAKEMFPTYVTSQAFQKAIFATPAELWTAHGIEAPKTSQEAAEAAAKNKAAGPPLTREVSSILGEMKGPDGQPLTPTTATADQIAKAGKQVKQDRVDVSAAQGLAVETMKRGLSVSPETRSKHISVKALMERGELIQPPAGITQDALNQDPDMVAVDDKQKARLTQLAPARAQLDVFQNVANRIITAKSPTEALAQGTKLYLGAFTGSDPVAKGYLDAAEGFIGNLSRAIGGETGVLTNLDVTRMRRAAYASFFDTAASRDIKAAIINDIWKSSQAALVAEISGKSTGVFRSQLIGLLDKLDKETHLTLGKAPKDIRQRIEDRALMSTTDKPADLVFDPATGTLKPKGKK